MSAPVGDQLPDACAAEALRLGALAGRLGVGQSRSSSVRFPPLDRVPEQARGVGQVVVFAVGEDEEPLAPVGRADFRPP